MFSDTLLPRRANRTAPLAFASTSIASLATSMRIFTVSGPTRLLTRTPSPSAVSVDFRCRAARREAHVRSAMNRRRTRRHA